MQSIGNLQDTFAFFFNRVFKLKVFILHLQHISIQTLNFQWKDMFGYLIFIKLTAERIDSQVVPSILKIAF